MAMFCTFLLIYLQAKNKFELFHLQPLLFNSLVLSETITGMINRNIKRERQFARWKE